VFERRRIERREKPEIRARTGQTIQGRGSNARGIDEIARHRAIEQRRVDGRVGIQIRYVPEDPFRAASLIEVVVDERYCGDWVWRGNTSATMYRCR
jgi:hypothetical protein